MRQWQQRDRAQSDADISGRLIAGSAPLQWRSSLPLRHPMSGTGDAALPAKTVDLKSSRLDRRPSETPTMRPPHTCCDPTLTDGEPGLSICQTSLSAIGGSGYGALRQQGSARERRGARPGCRGGPPAGSAGCKGRNRRPPGQSGPSTGCRARAGCVLRPARCDFGSRLGPRCRSRPEARRLARLGQQRRKCTSRPR